MMHWWTEPPKPQLGIGNCASHRVRAAVMVDRWVYKRFEDTFELADGELFERALELQSESDRLAHRWRLDLRSRLISSPFRNVRLAAMKQILR